MSSEDLAPGEGHAFTPDVSFDGGDMDCGNGLLLHIRRHLDPLAPGGLLEIRSTEPSVELDLPAWCRLTGNELVSWTRVLPRRSFLVCKGVFAPAARAGARGVAAAPAPRSVASRVAAVVEAVPQGTRALPVPIAAPQVPALAVMGVGSWPRPRWMLDVLHARLEGRLDDAAFQTSADDAVRLAVMAQQRAGATVFTDGEQRRDSYANFIGMRLDDCQSIPLVDLLPLVDDPEKLRREFESLDVPADAVRHPALFGKLRRTRPIARHEADFLRGLIAGPIKVAIPGPYLLSRLLWLECVSDRAYASREELAVDIVTVLREELFDLLAAGVSIVQLDEPVLSEVVFGAPTRRRSFMCGALSERKETPEELAFARDLINAVVAGAPRERIALHMCRGNWTPDESAALSGAYDPLVETLGALDVGAWFLEACTPRAGELDVLRRLPDDRRLGLGVVNPKDPAVESVDAIEARMRQAIDRFGRERLVFHPDCGFATFADNPVASAAVAEAKLANMVAAAQRLG